MILSRGASIITGASHPVAVNAGYKLLSAGLNIFFVDRDPRMKFVVDHLNDDIKTIGKGFARFCPLDVENKEGIQKIVDFAMRMEGCINSVVVGSSLTAPRSADRRQSTNDKEVTLRWMEEANSGLLEATHTTPCKSSFVVVNSTTSKLSHPTCGEVQHELMEICGGDVRTYGVCGEGLLNDIPITKPAQARPSPPRNPGIVVPHRHNTTALERRCHQGDITGDVITSMILCPSQYRPGSMVNVALDGKVSCVTE